MDLMLVCSAPATIHNACCCMFTQQHHISGPERCKFKTTQGYEYKKTNRKKSVETKGY
jgi:hypothetical protein